MEHSDTGRSRRGAYGVAAVGLEAEARLLVPAQEHWPTLRIVTSPAPPQVRDTFLGPATARFPDVQGAHVEVDRDAGVATFRGVGGLTSDALVHPRLGMLAALYAHWLPDRMSFHAGAFVSEGRALAVVGERASGKSTLMGALAVAGVPVVGDDTLVVEDSACLPGVRCVDLRPDAAARLDVRDRAATVRAGARRRLPLPAPPREAPLAGWVFLAWGEALGMRAMPPAERLARIANAQGWHRRGVTEPTRLLDAAALPAWELTRPRDWAQLGQTVSRVRELCSGAGA